MQLCSKYSNSVTIFRLTRTRSKARGLRTRMVNVEEMTLGGSFSSGRNMCWERGGGGGGMLVMEV